MMFINDKGLITCPNPQGGPWPKLTLAKPYHVNPENGNIRIWFYLEYTDGPPIKEWMEEQGHLLVSLEAPDFSKTIHRRYCYAEISNPKEIFAAVNPDHLLDIKEGYVSTKDEKRYFAKELLEGGYDMIIYEECNRFCAFLPNPAKTMVNCVWTEETPWIS